MNKKIMFLLLTIIGFIITSFVVLLPSIKRFNFKEINTIMKKYDCEIKKNHIEYDSNYEIEFYRTNDNKCNYDIIFIKSKDNNFIHNRYKELVNEVYKNEEVTGRANINILNRYYERATDGINYKIAKLNNDTIFYLSTDKKNRELALMIEKEIGFYYEPRWGALILFIFPLIFFRKYEEYKTFTK